VGDFVGVGVAHDADEENLPLSVRNLDVSIRQEGDGFTLRWMALVHRGVAAVPRFEVKSTELTFEPTDRPQVFEAEDSRRRDADEGVSWARIKGNMLVVYELAIGNNGLFELTSYRRTLVESGMNLIFVYQREGSPVRTVTGSLQRVADQ
jgi:hypothetical protein